jgi:hypothetical protein
MFRAPPCPFHVTDQQPEEELPIEEGGEGLSSDETVGGASPSNAAGSMSATARAEFSRWGEEQEQWNSYWEGMDG